jgi:hypothetical protein
MAPGRPAKPFAPRIRTRKYGPYSVTPAAAAPHADIGIARQFHRIPGILRANVHLQLERHLGRAPLQTQSNLVHPSRLANSDFQVLGLDAAARRHRPDRLGDLFHRQPQAVRHHRDGFR